MIKIDEKDKLSTFKLFSRDLYHTYLFNLLDCLKGEEKRIATFARACYRYKSDIEYYRRDIDQSYYKSIIIKFKALIKELNIKDSLSISILFSYLLWNGYLSKDKKLVFDRGTDIKSGLYAYSIMRGNGVCINFSDMLKDILNEVGYESAILLNREGNIKRNYDLEITRNRKRKLHFPNVFSRLTGNHAFNLIKDNDSLYIYDPTNILAINLSNKNKPEIICGSGKIKLFPLQSYAHSFDSSSNNLLDYLYTSNKFNISYTKDDFINLLSKVKLIMKKEEDKLDSFHNDIKFEIDGVSRILEKR